MQSSSILASGESVAVLSTGNGPAVIIVHGLGGHKEDFTGVMERLAARGLRVYAFDMLGFGASSRTAPSVSITSQSEVIAALMASAGIARAHVVGNSLGGWVAATFAARHPALTASLTMIDAAGLKITLSGPPPVNFAPDTVAEMQALLRTVIASPFAHTDEFAAGALAAFKANGEAATLGRLFTGFAAPDNTDLLLDDVLPKVTAPTLVVWGEQDGLFPVALADIVAGGVPGARKVTLPTASHFPQIDDPDGLAAAIGEFVAGVSA